MWRLIGMLVVMLSLCRPSLAAPPCVGDCESGGTVTVDELVKSVGIALGTAQVDQCPGVDGNDSGEVTVDELVTAVNNALSGCPDFIGDYTGGVDLAEGQTATMDLTSAANGQATATVAIYGAGNSPGAGLLALLWGGGAADLLHSFVITGTVDLDTGEYSLSGSFVDESQQTVAVEAHGGLPLQPGAAGTLALKIGAETFNGSIVADNGSIPTPPASPTPTRTPSGGPTSTPAPGGSNKIVFVTTEADFSTNIHSIKEIGTLETNLTISPGVWETQPSWSADGTKILYRSGDNSIKVMNPDGSGKQTVLTSSGPVYYPAWSPDGSHIVFVADESLQTQNDNTIEVVNTDGSGRHTVLAQKGNYLSPTYNQDGSKIAFAGSTGLENSELFVMTSDGSGLTQITDEGIDTDGPVWSPDGSTIAFQSADPVTGDSGIYLINPDGTDKRFLVSGRSPGWSRTGAKLAYSVFAPDFTQSIRTINADGTGDRAVRTLADAFDPDID